MTEKEIKNFVANEFEELSKEYDFIKNSHPELALYEKLTIVKDPNSIVKRKLYDKLGITSDEEFKKYTAQFKFQNFDVLTEEIKQTEDFIASFNSEDIFFLEGSELKFYDDKPIYFFENNRPKFYEDSGFVTQKTILNDYKTKILPSIEKLDSLKKQLEKYTKEDEGVSFLSLVPFSYRDTKIVINEVPENWNALLLNFIEYLPKTYFTKVISDVKEKRNGTSVESYQYEKFLALKRALKNGEFIKNGANGIVLEMPRGFYATIYFKEHLKSFKTNELYILGENTDHLIYDEDFVGHSGSDYTLIFKNYVVSIGFSWSSFLKK